MRPLLLPACYITEEQNSKTHLFPDEVRERVTVVRRAARSGDAPNVRGARVGRSRATGHGKFSGWGGNVSE